MLKVEKIRRNKVALLTILLLSVSLYCPAQNRNLKLVFIRHAEKPVTGSNLTCKGLNRSLQLVGVLTKKFGVPDYLMVPSLGLGDTTRHSRMFQTIAPLAMKYNLAINTGHNQNDYERVAADLKGYKGTVVITWEHKGIPQIVKALGIKDHLLWSDDDYDSIWIITFKNGIAQLIKDKEDLHPTEACPM